MKRFACLFAILILSATTAFAANDILIADFEGQDYGDWVATGDAFGKAPAHGSLGGQMAVSGFKGKGLINTFLNGDRAVGTLTSPAFKIERAAINFLIGGGGYADTTCMNLLIDGKRVLTAQGPNVVPGGSEKLDWQGWDVKKWKGQMATIQIVDARKEGWGHINVDHIVQSDKVAKVVAKPVQAKITRQREMRIDQPYLLLPVKNGGSKVRMRLVVGGETAREFDIELAEAQEDQWMFMDMAVFQSKSVILEANNMSAGSKGLDAAKQSATLPNAEGMYKEKYRPQFHFTSRRGWLNDPNGLVYYKGEWHLYYQHNPYGINWGNMHWGHAVSTDLLHWKELPVAIYPARHGDWAFSGSGLVDWKNTGGFKTGEEDVIIAPFTSTGRGEVIYYSNDRGRTFTEYKGNPVVEHKGRDPKVIWHEKLGEWSMAVYDEFEGKRYIAFYTSPDLKEWTFQSRIEGFFECPDIFQLPVQGTDRAKWVLYAADGKYMLGEFDGKVFTPEGEKQTVWYGNFYAAQSYSDAPDNRRVQIGWGRGITFPGMPFNQQMVIPVDLTLRETEAGVRMFAEPVPEVNNLRGKTVELKDFRPGEGDTKLPMISGDLFDIEATIAVGDAEIFGLSVRGVPVLYDVKKGELSCGKLRAPLAPVDGKIKLRVLADRGSIEVFGNDGRVALSLGVIPDDDNHHPFSFISKGGETNVPLLIMTELKSVW